MTYIKFAPIKFTHAIASNFTKKYRSQICLVLDFAKFVKLLGKFTQTPNVTAKSNLKTLQKSLFYEIRSKFYLYF